MHSTHYGQKTWRKQQVFKMKKKIVVGCMALLCIGALWFPFLNVDKKVEFEKIQKIAQTFVDDGMQRQEGKTLRRLYQTTQEEYEEAYSYGPISYMEVDEITIFKQSDETKRKALLNKTTEHIKKQIKSFEGYGIEQTKLLKDSYVQEKGDYVICIVHKDASTIANKIEALF